MSSATVQTTPDRMPTKKWMLWSGRVLSGLPIFALTASAVMKIAHAPQMVANLTTLGWSERQLTYIGLLELGCVALFAIPRTAAIGALLVACYLAAAFSVHVRVGDPGGALPIILAVMAWAGLWLRDARIRALFPLRVRD